jgi:hypothetical protein
VESEGKGSYSWVMRTGITVRKSKIVSLPLNKLPFHSPEKEEQSLLPCAFSGEIFFLLDKN